MSEIRHCPGWDDHPSHDLPEDEFYREPKRDGGGYSAYCKGCTREKNRRYWRERYYPANTERQIAAVTQRRKERKREAQANNS